MLFQPTNVIPSSFAGVGGDLIDATDGMTISWQVNGTSPMTGYQIVIYRNNTTSDQLYDTGEVTLSDPFYGVDGMGNVQRFSVDISAATLSANNIINGNADGYKFKITQFWVGGSITQTAENYFICQATPSAAIDTTEITSPTVTLTGTYTQADGVGLDWVRWIITADGQTVEDSGNIHTQILSYTYNGFLDSTTYDITLEYQTESGYQGSVSKSITAGWSSLASRLQLLTSMTDDCAGIIISRSAVSVAYITYQNPQHYTIHNGMLTVPNTYYVGWAGPSEQTGKSVVLSCQSPSDGSRLRISNVWDTQYKDLGIDFAKTSSNESLKILAINNYGVTITLATINLPIGTLSGNVITVIVSGYNVFAKVLNGALYSAEITREGYAFESGKNIGAYLYGYMVCYYLGIKKGAISQDGPEIGELSGSIQPTLDDTWVILSDWGGVGAENIGTILATFTVFRMDDESILYRDNESDGKRIRLGSADAITSLIDYGVKSGKAYTYNQYFSLYNSSSGGTPYLSTVSSPSPITPCFWNWIVDTGVWDDTRGAYEYTGSYIFGLNLETDAFDNGNSPNLMQNFTRYPTRQGTNQNYLSGQLTAYLGHVDKENNVYIDTAAEAEAIRALSTSTDTKFLRSRKGERWMIDTSGPIRLSLGDKYREQPYTVSLPWVEVGDAADAALISLPGDAAWPL